MRIVTFAVVAACLGTAAVGFGLSDLPHSAIGSRSGEGQGAEPTPNVTAVAHPSNLLPSATAATPALPLRELLVSLIKGGDSRLDNYQLERDSCCLAAV